MKTGRRVKTAAPSFPEVIPNRPLEPRADRHWQVLCGDRDHWRLGFYSPGATSPGELLELERHDCPELFLLLSGRLVLVLAEEQGSRELELTAGQPVLVTAPHAGYCPDGPHSGTAVVVERDSFETEYRPLSGWLAGKSAD